MKQTEINTHLSHCYQGEYKFSCKYLEKGSDCPAFKISDYDHCKNLSKHAKCCKLNKFTRYEYYHWLDVKDFIQDVLEFVPDVTISLGVDEETGEEFFSTTHKQIIKRAGKNLLY